MTVKNAHLLFEQSGTFKNEFLKLGVPAYDYDLLNDFGQTDFQCDLFQEIEMDIYGIDGLFSRIKRDDLIMAFFPCTYFCENNVLYFTGKNINYRGMTMEEKLQQIIERDDMRHLYYKRLMQLFQIVERRHLKMIVENPYNPHHYWRFNLPYKPAVIDMNRLAKGDFYKKPTQYLFINCTPGQLHSLQYDKHMKYINSQSVVNRSMISPDYARNFICDYILEIRTENTINTLF